MELLSRLVDTSLQYEGVDYKRRSRILIDTSLAVLIFNFIVALTLFGPLQDRKWGWATLVVFFVGVLVLPILRFTGSVTISGNVLLSQIWALLHILTIYAEMVKGIPPAWIIFLPVLAMHICNKLSSLVWTVLAVSEIFVMGWLAIKAEQLSGGSLFLYLGTHLGLLVLMVTTAYLNERFKDSTLEALSATNQELSVARDRALEASRAKSTFVANMSHELRTPLNAVIGYSDMLVEDVEAVEPRQLKEDLQRIKASGQHLLRLINQLLEFSRLEAGPMKLTLESFRLDHLIRELMQTMERAAAKNGNEMVYFSETHDEEHLTVVSDSTKLRQCLYNLVSNACKFTSKGRILVTLERVEASEDCDSASYLLVVEDTGIGMTPEQLDRVFEPFVQAEESIARRFGGTGLGLSLSRRLAESLGGTLEGFSEDGKGSRFVLTLPARVAEGQESMNIDGLQETESGKTP